MLMELICGTRSGAPIESLWLVDVEKSPHNGRGLMNYGLTQMAKGAYPVALDYFQRALLYTPNYQSFEINLGIIHGVMNQAAEAELHFQRAIQLAPTDDETHFFYGPWLYQSGRIADALPRLETAVRLNPSRITSFDPLTAAYATAGETERARDTAMKAFALAPADTAAKNILYAPVPQSADYWINASLYQYQGGNYLACIADAKQALKLKPDSELAYNNIGAAYAGLHQWNPAIENEREALRIKPNFALAANNLALYTHEKAGQTSQPPHNMTAEARLNVSLQDNHAGDYLKSIEDARAALRIRPDYAEAYNNIAASYASMG